MRKLSILILFAFLLALPMTSAANWDNIHSYDAATKTNHIYDGFGLGGEIINITLLDNTYKCDVWCSADLKLVASKDIKEADVEEMIFNFFDTQQNMRAVDPNYLPDVAIESWSYDVTSFESSTNKTERFKI